MSRIVISNKPSLSREGGPATAGPGGLKDLIHSQNIIGLSPMDGYTDEAFRLVVTKISKPDVIFTEFVSAEGLSRGGVKLYDTLLFSSIEHPIVGQLFG